MRLVRKLLDCSQGKLADAVGTSQGNWGRWEKDTKPSYEFVLIIARALSVTPQWLLSGDVRPNIGNTVGMVFDRVFKGSQGKASKLLEVPEKFLSAIISGEIDAADEFLQRIAEETGTTLNDILGNAYRHHAPILPQDKEAEKERLQALEAQGLSDDKAELRKEIIELRDKNNKLVDLLAGCEKRLSQIEAENERLRQPAQPAKTGVATAYLRSSAVPGG